MPQEEIIKYKIQIDSSDLGGQLEGIKRQLDTAMGQVAFMKGGKQPEPMDFYQPIAAAGAQATGTVGPQGAQNWASQMIQETKQQIDQTSNRVFGDLSQFLESSKLWVQKFTSDLQ